jgi:hypothetical protein
LSIRSKPSILPIPRDVGVAREIAIDLDREGIGAEQHFRGLRAGSRSVGRVDHGRDVVADHDFLEQAPEHQPGPGPDTFQVDPAVFDDLGQEPAGAFDRAGHQLREEGHEQREVQQSAGRLDLAAIDVYGVAQGLKGIERNSDWKHHLERERPHGDADCVQQLGKALGKEAEILEDPEDPQIDDHAGGDQTPAAAPIIGFRKPDTERIIDHRRQDDQTQETPVPGTVKDVAGGQQPSVLRPMRKMRKYRIDREYDDEEERELEAVEQHGVSRLLHQTKRLANNQVNSTCKLGRASSQMYQVHEILGTERPAGFKGDNAGSSATGRMPA